MHVKRVEFFSNNDGTIVLVNPVATYESPHLFGLPGGRFTIGCGSPNHSSQSQIGIEEEESDAAIV